MRRATRTAQPGGDEGYPGACAGNQKHANEAQQGRGRNRQSGERRHPLPPCGRWERKTSAKPSASTEAPARMKTPCAAVDSSSATAASTMSQPAGNKKKPSSRIAIRWIIAASPTCGPKRRNRWDLLTGAALRVSQLRLTRLRFLALRLGEDEGAASQILGFVEDLFRQTNLPRRNRIKVLL